ncbi:MAG: hypothetical protein LDL13_01645 [Calditerrivibrio sp.]|nr:hypothetical protein [Calditerrivibrio sp.]MCA1932267.1 hypothetical protein [Calditerrivibrio sp.]
MKKLVLFLIIISFLFYLVYKYGKVEKAVLDNNTLESKKETTYSTPSFSDTEKALKALQNLSKSNTGFTEIPEGLTFEEVKYDNNKKITTIFAEYRGEKISLGSFQESRILLQIFKTVNMNIVDAEKFRIIFKGGNSPFYEIKYDGLYSIDGENIILVGE